MKTLRNTVFHRFGLIDQQNHHWIISLLIISLLVLPFGFMTYKGLFGALSAMCLVLSIVAVFIKSEFSNSFFKEKYSNLIIFCLIVTPATILTTQLIRGHLFTPAFDGPIRLLASLPILIAIYKHRINFSKLLSLSIPLALLGIFIFAKFHPNGSGPRLSSYYLDAIFWGNFSIILGFMCFASIESKDHFLIKVYKFFGLVLGISMSLLSQSRAGWITAILMALIWLMINRKELSLKKILFYIFVIILIFLTLYIFLDTFKLRIDLAIAELFKWQSNSQIPTSTGVRLTMWKMTIHLFSLSPWIGYGEFSTLPLTNNPYIFSFADPVSVEIIKCCGPHNEIAAQALKSGILGVFSLLAIYLIPIYIFLQLEKSQSILMGMMLCTGMIFCGFGTEMLGLKISYTLYALLLAGLLATSLWKCHEQK